MKSNPKTAGSDYSAIIKVGQSAKKAFEGISNVGGWWNLKVEGKSQKIGDTFKVSFGTTWKVFKVIEAIPGKKIVWEVTDCHMPWNKNKTEWTGTRVAWEISNTDGSTEIKFIHEGLVPALNCYDACSNAWGGYLQGSLRSFINTGRGQPD